MLITEVILPKGLHYLFIFYYARMQKALPVLLFIVISPRICLKKAPWHRTFSLGHYKTELIEEPYNYYGNHALI